MEIEIPGTGTVILENILLDYNGTLAFDGRLIPPVKELLNSLSEKLSVHVITADTFGMAEAELAGINCSFIRLEGENQSEAKLAYLEKLGKERTACIGNGRNDRLMVKSSCIGISVIQGEGVFTETALASDIICTDIISALELFTSPKRLIATMRD